MYKNVFFFLVICFDIYFIEIVYKVQQMEQLKIFYQYYWYMLLIKLYVYMYVLLYKIIFFFFFFIEQGKFVFKNGRIYEGMFVNDYIVEYLDFIMDGIIILDIS